MTALSIRHADGQAIGSRNSLKIALAAARTAADNRGRDIVVLDLRKLTAMCDYFVVATGTSRRQLHSISEEVDRVLEKELGDRRMGLEGYQESRWILLDYGDVVIHVFDDETRDYYDLEGLWSGAQRVDVSGVLGPHGNERETISVVPDTLPGSPDLD